MTFRLKPARPLTIEVVDENGAPMPKAEVSILYGEFAFSGGPTEGHRHLISAMPDGPFEIRVDLAGRSFDQPHDPAVSEATVVLPVPGSVFTVLDDATTAGRTGRLVLNIRPPDIEMGRGYGKMDVPDSAVSDLEAKASSIRSEPGERP